MTPELYLRRVCSRFLVLCFMGCVTIADADMSLIEAVKNQHRDVARALIAGGDVNVNEPQPDGATALHWAVHRDDLEVTQLLLEAGANANAINDFGVMPMSLAATNRNASIVRTLLDAGANADAALLTGETVLMRAAHSGDLEVVESLLEHGADINASEPVRLQTALMWALGEGHTNVARKLIEHGADIQAKTSLNFTPLMFAARAGNVEATQLLLDAGAEVNAIAIKMRDQTYLRGKPGEHVNDKNGMGALHVATVRGHADVVRLLLENGADPNYEGPGYTPLHWACGTWETELNGKNGMTAPRGHEWDMLRGVQEGKVEMVRALLEHGADPNTRMKDTPSRFGFTVTRSPGKSTPLTLAAFAGAPEVMKALVEHGADMSLKPDNGLSPLLTAAGVGRFTAELAVPEEDLLAAVKMAVELGADVNETDRGGNTAMHGAAFIRSTKIVQFLFDQGADVNAKNKQGHTPFRIAEHDSRSAGYGPKVVERLPVGHLLLELSVPSVVKESFDDWANLPQHVRDAVEALLEGERNKPKEPRKRRRS